MTARDDAITMAWLAIPDSHDFEDLELAARIVDVVSPIIRADELERLREQVTALEVREPWGPAGAQMIDRAQVLRLLGGGSDG